MKPYGCPAHDTLLGRLHAHGIDELDEAERATAMYAIEECDGCAAIVDALLDDLALGAAPGAPSAPLGGDRMPPLPAANNEAWLPGDIKALRLTATMVHVVEGSIGGGAPTPVTVEAGDPVSFDLWALHGRHMPMAPIDECTVSIYIAEQNRWILLESMRREFSGALVMRPPQPGRRYMVTFAAAALVIYYVIETSPGSGR